MVFDPKERVTSSDESDNNFPISLIDFLGIIPDISPETLFVVKLVDIASLWASVVTTVMFLSSIFKKNKNYLGLNRFKLLSTLTNKKVIALGGISNKNLKKLNLVNCKGFAGISIFQKKNGPLKKGPLCNRFYVFN